MVFIRNTYVTDDIVFMKSEDDLFWIKINGVTVGLTDDLYIGLSYVVPEGSSRYIRNDENTFDRLIDSLA